MEKEVRLIDADSLKERFLIVAQSGGPVVVHVSDICAAIEDEVYEGTVDAVEVVHGRWREKILVGGFAEEWGFVCSECGCTVSDRSNLGIGRYASNNQRLNYCPNCGAKMDGDVDG